MDIFICLRILLIIMWSFHRSPFLCNGRPSAHGSANDNTNVDCDCYCAESAHFSQTVPRAPQCEEAPMSGSSNVSMKSDGEIPRCDEAPSSSSSSDVTKSNIINSILHDDIVNVDGNHLDLVMEYIGRLLQLTEKKKPTGSSWIWPDGSGSKKLKEIQSPGGGFFSDLKDDISRPFREILKGIGNASFATAGLLVVAYGLERFDGVSTHKEERVQLLKEMYHVGSLVKQFKESPKGMQNVIEEATALIVEGAIMCSLQIDSSYMKRFLTESRIKDDLRNITQKLDRMYLKMNVQIGLSVLTAIESQGKPPLSRGYPKHAVGIDESITEVFDLLEFGSEENAVTVILHGLGGTGKTTLADALFSLQTVECKYSKVRLFKDIDSRPDIITLQKDILKDLMRAEETIPDIRTYEDGQRELECVLREVQAFIYIDNVLEGAALKKLLPEDMDTAKKVRLLLTAREENVKIACPRLHTKTKVYLIKDIPLKPEKDQF